MSKRDLRSRWGAVLLALVVSVLLTGCPPGPDPDAGNASHPEGEAVTGSDFFFPQLTPSTGERAFPQALLEGALRLEGRCLRVEGGGTSYSILWPPHVRMENADGSPLLVDDKSRETARIGGDVRLSGGEIEAAAPIFQELREPLPADCPGPYWLAGGLLAR